jgi:uncharacterized damage-inducible protein DinB
MSLVLDLGELLDYSDHERRKWKAWVATNPARIQIAFQPNGRFPTIGSVFDHIFLVERRHLARLEGGTPPDATGVPPGDWEALFDYGELVRADLRTYISDLTEAKAREQIAFSVQSGSFTMTRRKLAAHIFLHEERHLAQIAYAARAAGQAPPGEHDLFYYAEFA